MYNQKTLKGIKYSSGKYNNLLQCDINQQLGYFQAPWTNFYKSTKSKDHWHKNSFYKKGAMNSSVYTSGMNSFLSTNPIGTHHFEVNQRQHDLWFTDNLK